MEKYLLYLLLLLTTTQAHAQLTLGMTQRDLRVRYTTTPYLSSWEASVSDTGDSTVVYRDTRNGGVIASYLLHVGREPEPMVVACTVFGSQEVFLPRFMRQCSRYTKRKPGEYVNDGLRYVVGVKEGVAFMRVTLLHE